MSLIRTCDKCDERLTGRPHEIAVFLRNEEGHKRALDYCSRACLLADAIGQGAALIAVERGRQLVDEGWTADHDAGHPAGQLATAGAMYALRAFAHTEEDDDVPARWPWEAEAWKPGDRIRMLVKAGALIAAELDREHATASPTEG